MSFIILSNEERGRICADLENIIAGMELLSKLDTSSIPKQDLSLNLKTDLRKDEVTPSFPRNEILKNAPKANAETFVVPKTVE
ncbi:MAG: Asp-tRNA(Asn)/Glu-tRNA(Gln) amidotransferase subunit GatC [Fibromonadales bacterium]|nr:Asp-tRNA(Asn)/Glu-tRNA(Gln) amidotransferase subunit GatC [Fibromonadales bacterium]